MPAALTVRPYEPSDADAVWRVHEAALRAAPIPYVEGAPADEPLREIEAHYLGAGGAFLVGEVGEEVVAVGGFVPLDDGSEDDGFADDGPVNDGSAADAAGDDADDRDAASVVELRHVRVHPGHQRRGYGSQLVAALEERAREAGVDAVELETVEHLEAALALYRELGYEVVERDEHPGTGAELLRLRREL